MNKNQDSVLLSLSMAFNTVDHIILLGILKKVGGITRYSPQFKYYNVGIKSLSHVMTN